MTDREFPISHDFTLSSILALIILTIILAFQVKYSFESNDFSIFITLLGILIGFLFTVLTVLYAFEDTLKNNPAFKELSARGHYKKIYPIFIDSISVNFYALVIIIILYFLRTLFTTNAILNFVLIFLVANLLLLSLLRAHKCIFIFSYLQRIMSKYKINPKTAKS